MIIHDLGRESRGIMDVSRGLSPTAARRRLGAMLRDVRERAALTLDEAGAEIERSAATIHRLETGKVKPRLVDVGALLDGYASRGPGLADDERELILGLASDSRREAWFSPFRDVLAGHMISDHMRRFVEFETDATSLETYEPDLVPGLLQIPDYTAALAERFIPNHSSEQRDRFVEFRQARQDVLRRNPSPLRYHAVIAESVVRRVVGGSDVMRAQLTRLADVVRTKSDTLMLQIAPSSLLTMGTIGGSFVIMSFDDSPDDDLVYLEGRSGAEYLQSETQLSRYRRDFADLTAQAADRATTLSILEEAVIQLT